MLKYWLWHCYSHMLYCMKKMKKFIQSASRRMFGRIAIIRYYTISHQYGKFLYPVMLQYA